MLKSYLFKITVMILVFATKGFCNDRVYREIGHFKQYGGRRHELIDKFMPENPVIFEAGGHYGEDTVKLAKRWPDARVISFEPNPAAFKKLSAAIDGYDQIEGYNLAVNNYNGSATLHVCYGTTGKDPIFEGASSLLEPTREMAIHYQGPKVTVPCVILDDWCKKNEIDHFDFLWLDLEGLELQVLKSSPEILSKASVIYTETNMHMFRKGTTPFTSLYNLLTRAGFKLAAHWYDEGLQGDAVFVKKDLLDKVLKRK